MSGGGGSANKEAKRMRKAEEKRQKQIRKGTDRIDRRFSQFDDDFYKGRRDAYTAFATPMVEDQYEDAGDDLAFHLTRSGLTDSSVRGEKGAELTKMYDLRKQEVADGARSTETEARNAVEGARGDLVSLLQTTGDARGAAQGAQARATALSRTPQFSPLEQLFVDFTAGLGTQAQFERAASYGGPKPRYNTGIFNPTKSVEVKR